MLVVHHKNQYFLELTALLTLKRMIELHFGNRNLTRIIEVRNPAITPRINTDINVRLIHHLQ